MAEIKVKIPDELNFIRQVPDIDWSLLFNKVMKEQLEKIVELKRIVSKSQLSEKDVEELTEKINKSILEKY